MVEEEPGKLPEPDLGQAGFWFCYCESCGGHWWRRQEGVVFAESD